MNLFHRKRDGKTLSAAPKPFVDPRVAHRLDLTSLTYEIAADGHYRVNWHLEDGERVQTAHVDSKVTTFRGGEWRKVYCFSFKVAGPFSQEQACELLADAENHGFGGWCLSRQGGATWALYQVSVDSDALSFHLKEAIALVCTVADAMEKKVAARSAGSKSAP